MRSNYKQFICDRRRKIGSNSVEITILIPLGYISSVRRVRVECNDSVVWVDGGTILEVSRMVKSGTKNSNLP